MIVSVNYRVERTEQAANDVQVGDAWATGLFEEYGITPNGDSGFFMDEDFAIRDICGETDDLKQAEAFKAEAETFPDVEVDIWNAEDEEAE